MALSKLTKVDLRDEWPHEASDFTNWLAKDESLQLLSEEINIDISLIQTEASVGKFSVDILAEEENTGRKVVIENQLETTNHDHLGKIITYASGFDAEIVIWIVRDVRDEHKQAVDWLNEHTDDKINIFVIRMELWQIGNSPCAPKFHVVSQPNDWTKAIKPTPSDLSDRRLMQLEFWNQFKEFAASKHSTLRLRKSYPQHWYDISIGNSKSHLSLVVDADKGQIRCALYIPDSKPLFRDLLKQKEAIENKLINHKLQWMELDGKKASRIRTVLDDVDVEDTDSWEKCFQWLMDTAQEFQAVFSEHIKKINI